MLRMVKRIDQTVVGGKYTATITFECGHILDHSDPNHGYNPGRMADCRVCEHGTPKPKKAKGVWRT